MARMRARLAIGVALPVLVAGALALRAIRSDPDIELPSARGERLLPAGDHRVEIRLVEGRWWVDGEAVGDPGAALECRWERPVGEDEVREALLRLDRRQTVADLWEILRTLGDRRERPQVLLATAANLDGPGPGVLPLVLGSTFELDSELLLAIPSRLELEWGEGGTRLLVAGWDPVSSGSLEEALRALEASLAAAPASFLVRLGADIPHEDVARLLGVLHASGQRMFCFPTLPELTRMVVTQPRWFPAPSDVELAAELPVSPHGERRRAIGPETVRLFIERDGTCWIKRKRMSRHELRRYLLLVADTSREVKVASRSNVRLDLAVDVRTPWTHVREVLELAAGLGVWRTGLSARTRPRGPDRLLWVPLLDPAARAAVRVRVPGDGPVPPAGSPRDRVLVEPRGDVLLGDVVRRIDELIEAGHRHLAFPAPTGIGSALGPGAMVPMEWLGEETGGADPGK
jgi:biopolymer transport protein ExbD